MVVSRNVKDEKEELGNSRTVTELNKGFQRRAKPQGHSEEAAKFNLLDMGWEDDEGGMWGDDDGGLWGDDNGGMWGDDDEGFSWEEDDQDIDWDSDDTAWDPDSDSSDIEEFEYEYDTEANDTLDEQETWSMDDEGTWEFGGEGTWTWEELVGEVAVANLASEMVPEPGTQLSCYFSICCIIPHFLMIFQRMGTLGQMV